MKTPLKIPTQTEARELISELLDRTRYFPKFDPPKDGYGMPVVGPEPDDPDDE